MEYIFKGIQYTVSVRAQGRSTSISYEDRDTKAPVTIPRIKTICEARGLLRDVTDAFNALCGNRLMQNGHPKTYNKIYNALNRAYLGAWKKLDDLEEKEAQYDT